MHLVPVGYTDNSCSVRHDVHGTGHGGDISMSDPTSRFRQIKHWKLLRGPSTYRTSHTYCRLTRSHNVHRVVPVRPYLRAVCRT